jgi:hypothetical protein
VLPSSGVEENLAQVLSCWLKFVHATLTTNARLE